MNVFLTRSNGDYSVHARVDRPDEAVAGEPSGPFDYRLKCLREGFARIGWPNTGDVLDGFRGRLAPNGYTLESIAAEHRRYLEEWVKVRVGDLVLIPAGLAEHQVHLGLVVRRTRRSREEVPAESGEPAYYYFHDLAGGDYYECAHRVDVRWHLTGSGMYAVHNFPELGGIWRRAFSRVQSAADTVKAAARAAGLVASP